MVRLRAMDSHALLEALLDGRDGRRDELPAPDCWRIGDACGHAACCSAHGLPCGSQHALASATILAPAPHGLAGWQRGENALFSCQSLIVSPRPPPGRPPLARLPPQGRQRPAPGRSDGPYTPWLRQASSQASPQATPTASSHDPHVNPLTLPLHVRRCVELNSNLGPSPLSQLSLRDC